MNRKSFYTRRNINSNIYIKHMINFGDWRQNRLWLKVIKDHKSLLSISKKLKKWLSVDLETTVLWWQTMSFTITNGKMNKMMISEEMISNKMIKILLISIKSYSKTTFISIINLDLRIYLNIKVTQTFTSYWLELQMAVFTTHVLKKLKTKE